MEQIVWVNKWVVASHGCHEEEPKNLGNKPGTQHQSLVEVTPRNHAFSINIEELVSDPFTYQTTIMHGLDIEGQIEIPLKKLTYPYNCT